MGDCHKVNEGYIGYSSWMGHTPLPFWHLPCLRGGELGDVYLLPCI